MVDELSLIRDEPTRVKINCRDPVAIRCGIEVFLPSNSLMKERGEGIWIPGGPSGTGRKDDKHDKSGRRDQDDAENNSRKRMGKFDRYGKIDKEHESNHGSQEAVEDMELYESDNYQVDPVPIAAFNPSTGSLEIMGSGKRNQGDYQIWDPTKAILQYKAWQMTAPEENSY